MRFSCSTTVTKVFVCFCTNTTLLQHLHNMVIILITKKLMPSGVSACLARWPSATYCETHTRIASTYSSSMSLTDAAIVLSPLRITLFFSFKFCCSRFRLLPWRRIDVHLHLAHKTYFSFASCHTPLWNVRTFIISWRYACISTFLLINTIVSELAIFVYDTKYRFFGIMYHVATPSHTSCLPPHYMLLKPPLHAIGTHQVSFLQPFYQLCPM